MPGIHCSAAYPLDRDRVQLVYRRGWSGFEVVIYRSVTYPTTTVPHTPMPESATTIGAFTVTVRGGLDASQRAEVLDRVRPRE